MKRIGILLLLAGLALPALTAAASETRIIPSPSSLPSGATIGAGGGQDRAKIGGVLNVNTTAVGNVGGGEDNLITYPVKPNTLSEDGKIVRMTAFGTTAANGNTKAVKCYFGATLVTNISTAGSAVDWRHQITVIRTGAATQMAVGTFGFEDGVGNMNYATPTEDTGTSITVKCTGQSTESTTNDIVQRGLIVEVMN